MPVSLNKNQFFFLVHVPKTGGTSLCHALNLEISSNQHQTWRAAPEGAISFSVVRDPVDRFLSSLRYAYSTRTYWHNERNSHIDKQTISKMSIDDVLNDLAKPPEERALKNVSWSDQHPWLFQGNRHMVDYILSYKNLEQNVNDMLSLYNLPKVRLPRVNVSEQKVIELSESEKKRVRKLYSKDYDLLGEFF